MSEENPSHEVEGIARRAPRHDCVEAQVWGRIPKNVCTIEDPQDPPTFLDGRCLEPPRLFLNLQHGQTEQSWEKGLGQVSDQDLLVTLTEL
jgi:hypothetical protein